MGSNGYEIRNRLIDNAKDLILSDWHYRCDLERQNASLEQRPAQYIERPPVNEILRVAEELYSFVKTPG